jgi:hypothetical protein
MELTAVIITASNYLKLQFHLMQFINISQFHILLY